MTALNVSQRPSRFEDVIGQGHVVKSLKKVVGDKRAHTFLFTGPSGTGKTTLARILANAFAGKESTIVNIEEVPAAFNTGVDDIRSVIKRTLYRAVGKSPVKAIIVDEAHRLSGAAWDALLIPIEHPPQHVYWMFCSTNPGKIPKTIITRCLRYDLKPVSEVDLFKLLDRVINTEGLNVGDDVLEAIAENSEGSPRQALVFLEACLYCESVNEARQVMRSAGQTREIVELCRWLLGGRSLTWAEAIKYVKGLEGNVEAESARIVITAYITKALLGCKDDKRAAVLLGTLECFSKPYMTSDKFAPLLYSIGLAIGLDR